MGRALVKHMKNLMESSGSLRNKNGEYKLFMQTDGRSNNYALCNIMHHQCNISQSYKNNKSFMETS